LIVHRALVFLLSAALAAGLTTGIVQAGSMDTPMTAMTPDTPMPSKCDGCAGSEKAVVPMACTAYCAGIVALASPSIAYDSVPAGLVVGSTQAVMAGHAFPPDPYPPKPTSMN
jgi:hypothetical protein